MLLGNRGCPKGLCFADSLRQLVIAKRALPETNVLVGLTTRGMTKVLFGTLFSNVSNDGGGAPHLLRGGSTTLSYWKEKLIVCGFQAKE